MDSAQQSSSIPAVDASNLVRRFGGVTALHDVSLTIQAGEFFSLLGPSGCGKTTFLRIVAGLDSPDSGSLRIAGEESLHVPANRRPVNTVFQSYALFPHMNVRDNVAFGLKMKKVAPAEIKTRVERAMDLVQISNLAKRQPNQLSGGQKQRVALARAIVNEPAVLLLDEPLAALDVKLRRELQQELHSLQRRLGITFIHVTHDQDEALGLSDRVAVMDHGHIAQTGTTAEIYEQPRTRFVAEFVGGCNILDVEVEGAHCAKTGLGRLVVAGELKGNRTVVALRPERILLGAQAGASNQFKGEVLATTYTGPETHLSIKAGSVTLKAVLMNSSGAARISEGENITFSIPEEALLVVDGSPRSLTPSAERALRP